jgi:putative alpha-1,2-mannosidase
VRQAAKALGKPASDVQKYGSRSMGFRNVWDPNTTSDGFTGFMQKRFSVRRSRVYMRLYALLS